MNDIGVLLAFGGLTLGIVAGQHAGPSPATGALAIGAIALVAAWFVSGRARLAVAVLALALIGSAQTQRALDGLVRSSLTAAIAREEPVTVAGVLADDPESGRF